MVQAGLARRVGVVGERGHAHAVDAADVYDARGVVLAAGPLEQRQAQLRQGEGALQVEREELGPRRVRVRVDVGAPGGPGVVDEDVQAAGLEAGQLGRERLALVEVLEVGGQRVDRAREARERLEVGDGGVAGGRVAARDVDFGAVGDEACCYHAADALGA